MLNITTNDKTQIKEKGILTQKKTKIGYNFIIDSKIINISTFLNKISNSKRHFNECLFVLHKFEFNR